MGNQSYSNNPKAPSPAGGNKQPPNPQKMDSKSSTPPQDPGSVAEEQLKKILSQLADQDPANIAEIIHQWLNEDKK